MPRKERPSFSIVRYKSFILIDYEILQNVVNIVGQCPECQYTPLDMENLLSKKMGWSNKLKISCYNCCWSKEMFTSKMIDKGTSSGQKGYEVNTLCIM